MNTATENEDYCLQVTDGSIGQPTAYSVVSDALFNEGNPSRDWDGIRWIELVGEGGACPLPWHYELAFQVKNDVANPCANPQVPDPAGCARQGSLYDDEVSGHYEYRGFFLYLESGYLNGEPSWLVDHEVGHALGLRDGGAYPTPTPTSVPTPTPTATPVWWGQCSDPVLFPNGSVMHAYGCNEPDWPTAEDIDAVEAQVPAGSSGGYSNFSFQKL